MFPQRRTAAATAALSRGKGLQWLCVTWVFSAWIQHREPAATSVTSANFPVWLQEGEFPLSLQRVGATCPCPGNVFSPEPAQQHVAGHGARGALLAPQSLESSNCSWPRPPSPSSDSQPVLFRAPGGLILASAGFQVPAIRETSFCPGVNNGSGSLLWECLTATCRVLPLYKTWQDSAKSLRICGKVTKYQKMFQLFERQNT